MGVLAQYRAQIPSENLTTLCQTQLVRLFSKQVKTELRQVYLKDYAQDPHRPPKDIHALGEHPHTPHATAYEGD